MAKAKGFKVGDKVVLMGQGLGVIQAITKYGNGTEVFYQVLGGNWLLHAPETKLVAPKLPAGFTKPWKSTLGMFLTQTPK